MAALFLALAFTPLKTVAQTSLTGKLQNYTAFQSYFGDELIVLRNRLRLAASREVNDIIVTVEGDILSAHPDFNELDFRLRNAHAEFFTPTTDIRIGVQQVIWGQTNGGFITDILTPVDLSEFLTIAQDDLRTGLLAFSATRYIGNESLQLVVAPTLQPNLIPDSDSRWFPVQTVPDGVPNVFPIQFRGPDRTPTLRDVQAALTYRWRPSLSFSADWMLYYWAHPQPAYSLDIRFPVVTNDPGIFLTETYRTSPMAGYSLQWTISDRFLLESESLIVGEKPFTFLPVSVNRLREALEDPIVAAEVLQEFELRDDGYLINKPWLQSMVGLQSTLLNTTVGVQAAVEIILNYESRLLPQKHFPYGTFFAQRTMLRDRLQLLALTRYNFFGEDYWIRAEGTYEVTDGFEVAVGTNYFDGRSFNPFFGHFTFRQFRDDSFIFLRTSLFF
ncbi:MAG: hypothetical protein ACNA78_00125 [Balneolaceae bacterium]